jgi:hypothetical protein
MSSDTFFSPGVRFRYSFGTVELHTRLQLVDYQLVMLPNPLIAYSWRSPREEFIRKGSVECMSEA